MVGLDSEARSCPTFPALSAPDGAVTAFVRERMLSWHQSRSSLCLGIGRQRKPVPGAVGAQRYPTMSLFAVWTVSQHGARSAPGCFHGRFPATTQRDPDPVTHWTDTALIFGLLSSGDYRLHRFRPFGPRPTRTWLLHLILFFFFRCQAGSRSCHCMRLRGGERRLLSRLPFLSLPVTASGIYGEKKSVHCVKLDLDAHWLSSRPVSALFRCRLFPPPFCHPQP